MAKSDRIQVFLKKAKTEMYIVLGDCEPDDLTDSEKLIFEILSRDSDVESKSKLHR
jgi:cAMP phosphodiesterase